MARHIEDYYDKYYAHRASFEEKKSIGAGNCPLPWITYPATFQMEQYSLTDCEVFEWGAGFSTLYWSSRCKSVTSVEHDKEWYEFVKKYNKDNIFLCLARIEAYAEQILEIKKSYDLIIVDGYIMDRMRLNCAEQAISHLKPGGIILIDNSDWLPNTCEFLRDEGFTQADYAGFGPINPYPWCTSLFFKNCISLPRLNVRSPGYIPGGLENDRD